MAMLTCDISETLMQALAARSAQTGEPLSHIVMSALADALGVDHSTLFQVSTSGALVNGIFDGVVTVGELKQHGDFGIGTFDGLDGELLALDGRFYQFHSSGAVAEAADEAMVPFAVVTFFRAETKTALAVVGSLDQLAAELDRLRGSANLFCAARIEGRFRRVRTRVARKAAPGETLIAATAHQAEFEFTDVAGVMAGFWTPAYARNLNVGGWHLHFLTADNTGGGHVLDCHGSGLVAMTQELADLRIALPESAAFLQADLSGDSSRELQIAEGARGAHDKAAPVQTPRWDGGTHG